MVPNLFQPMIYSRWLLSQAKTNPKHLCFEPTCEAKNSSEEGEPFIGRRERGQARGGVGMMGTRGHQP